LISLNCAEVGLTRRFVRVASDFLRNLGASVPGACDCSKMPRDTANPGGTAGLTGRNGKP